MNRLIVVVRIDVVNRDLISLSRFWQGHRLVDEVAVYSHSGDGLAQLDAVGVVLHFEVIDQRRARAILLVGVGVDGNSRGRPGGIIRR